MAEHPNVGRLRAGYEAFSSGDLDSVRKQFSDDILWHIGGNNMFTGDYKGWDEVMGFFAKLMEASGGTFRLEIHDILANDEHGVALVKMSVERNGKRLEQNVVHVSHLDADGRLTEYWAFPEDQRAVDEFWT